ncbi:hypothetical protein [Paenibacillus sp. HJGM_3]|uniref:hypothetical protein n=1 Tax=Paenibacillus sp. HJGM_3 TaxID=3379816 RepID=UPI00385E323C
MSEMHSYERSYHSQNGEDGILQELFTRIGETNRYFVEFGVENGLQCNTYFLAAHRGWSGLMMEGSPLLFPQLQVHLAPYPQVKTAHHFITRENIVSLFGLYGVPPEPDLLSIDIDGNDYWVWQALSGYRPRVVVIEYNAAYPPPRRMVVRYNPDFQWNGTTYYGASLSSLAELGKQLGYALIGTDSRGVNAFFVRRDVLPSSGFPELTAGQAYNPPGYGLPGIGHPHGSGPIVDG